MKKLPPAKRNQLMMVVIATLAMIGIIYYFLIGPQIQHNRKLSSEIAENTAKLQQIRKAVQQAEANAKISDEISTKLSLAEGDIATGDVYAWTYDTIRRFKSGYKIEIPSIGQPVQGDMDMLPDFPYKQIKFIISGTGYYHDLGKFVSDLENKFPHIRVLNLAIESPNDQTGEKLQFRMEIAALTKSNT